MLDIFEHAAGCIVAMEQTYSKREERTKMVREILLSMPKRLNSGICKT
jgi:hypothetical protein